MSDSTPESLSKAERLAIGGDVAPVLRRRASAPRRVTLVGKDGKPTGSTTDIEVAKSLLARSEIEFSVQPGKRPAFVTCKTCGLPVKASPRPNTPLPTMCRPGTHKCPCGRPLRTRGRCDRGRLCKHCGSADRMKTNRKRTEKSSDVRFRYVVSTSSTWSEAARQLRCTPKSAARRAQRHGIMLGSAIDED